MYDEELLAVRAIVMLVVLAAVLSWAWVRGDRSLPELLPYEYPLADDEEDPGW